MKKLSEAKNYQEGIVSTELTKQLGSKPKEEGRRETLRLKEIREVRKGEKMKSINMIILFLIKVSMHFSS